MILTTEEEVKAQLKKILLVATPEYQQDFETGALLLFEWLKEIDQKQDALAKHVIDSKIAESKQNGDGEAPNSAYWYNCGLFDACKICTGL